MYIDPHVHLRDFNQHKKETIRHGLEVARDSGLDAVLDMPNTDPPLVTRELVVQRIALAKAAGVPEVFYGMYLGLTSDPEQVKHAVDVYREFPEVVGFKLYAGHSVGNLGVVRYEDQAGIYEILSQQGYDGILVVHAEKEDTMRPHLWDAQNPISHCHARPESAEVASVQDQIMLASQYRFPGKLHIAHISSPRAVALVQHAKLDGMDISSGVCPHHFVYDWQQMASDQGILWKMNPPLRSPEAREQMLNLLRGGQIDWIETDHAPHTLDEKAHHPYLSGIPGLPWWPVFEEFLRRHDFSDALIEDLTFNNAAKRIGLPVERSRRRIIDRRTDYPFNPYSPIEIDLGYQPKTI